MGFSTFSTAVSPSPTFVKTCLHLLALCCCATVAVAQGERVLATAEQLYTEGREAYYDGDYRQAERLLLKSLRRYRRVPGHDTLAAFAKTHWRLADAYRHLRGHPPALAYLDSAAHYYRRGGEADALVYAEVDLDRGRVYSQMYRPAAAMAAHERARRAFERAHGARSPEVASLLSNMGIDLVKAGELRRAEAHYLEAVDILRECGTDTAAVAFNRLYNNLGVLYRKRGDYDRAVRFGERALAIKLRNYPPDHPSVGKYYNNIGRALQAQGRYPEAVAYVRRALEHSRRSLGEAHPSTAGAYGELSNVYADAGDWPRAERLMRRAIRLYAAHYEPWHPYRVAGTFNLGRLHEDAGDLDAALVAYRATLHQLRAGPEPPAERVAQTYEQIGKAYARQGRYPAAVAVFDTALALLAPGLPALLTPAVDTAADTAAARASDAARARGALLEVQDELGVLDVLDDRGLALLGAERPRAALLSVELAVALIDQLRATFPTEVARQFLRDDVDEVYRVGVEAAARLYRRSGDAEYLRRGLRLSDAGKAGSLRDHLREEDVRRLAGIGAADAARVDRLAADYRAARVSGEAVAVDAAAFALQTAREELRRRHPRYAALAAERPPLDLDALRAGLPEGTVLLDYHFGVDRPGGGELVVTLVSRDSLAARLVPLEEGFAEALARVRRLQRSPTSAGAARDTLLRALTTLHATLIAPVAAGLPAGAALVVSPDDRLHDLPFELLVEAPDAGAAAGDFRRAPYLLRRHAVSYVAAASLVGDQRERGGAGARGGRLVAFAPDFGDGATGTRARLGQLPYAQEEAATAAHYFSGEVLTGARASVGALRARAPRAGILHFATHGLVDDREPLASGLYLSPGERAVPGAAALPPPVTVERSVDPADPIDPADSMDPTDRVDGGFVSAADLYGMDLPSALTILSACHSADGELQSGEGALSLARAFRLAGSESVVASRWLANDRSTAGVLGHFYAHLAGGAARAEALRRAKLDYLESADALTAHPYYWAGLSLSGEAGPLPRARSWWWTAVGVAVVLLGATGYAVVRARRRPRGRRGVDYASTASS